MNGRYIVIEGGDGAGKDTQIARLREEFGEEHFVYTREPGGTPLGRELRRMLLDKPYGAVSLPAELFLFLGDRAEHIEEVVKPALARGIHVISNRSWLSLLAYQIYGRSRLEWKPVVELSLEKIMAGVSIDRILILDVPAHVGEERQRAMGKALDVFESEATDMRERVREAYRTFAKELPQASLIDATRSVDEVWTEVKAAVQSVL